MTVALRFGSNDPATYAGEMGIVEDEPVHLRIRSAHPGQRETDCPWMKRSTGALKLRY